jgi:iron complex transport system substrate-binding protein
VSQRARFVLRELMEDEMLKPTRRALAALSVVAALSPATAACSSAGSRTQSSAPSQPSASSRSSPARGSVSAAASFPVTVHAANGRVTISREPTRIVSVSPTATEDLFAIGAGEQVTAVDKNSDYPPAAPHTRLDSYQLNVEAIANYRPDLVIASGLSSAQGAQLAKLHIPALNEPAAADLQQAYQEITQLGQATGHPDGAAATITRMKHQLAAIVNAAPRRPATYYYELDQTYYSVSSATFIGQVLHLLGLTSIADAAKGAAAAGGYPQLSAEFILNANPGYVFLADTLCCKQSPATVAKRPGWSTLSAARGSRIVALNDDIASRWGPRIVDLLQTVATAIRQHPAS